MADSPGFYGRAQLNYNSYLKVSQLLNLQQCLAEPEHHDEMLFIVIHQVYELWFKMILRELENAMAYMGERKLLRAHHFLRRVVEIQKLLVSQIHILETMTPIEFLGFRDHLNPASGFQSLQFRELEFIAGLKDEAYFAHFEDQEALESLRRRVSEPDLWQCFQGVLRASGFDLPEADAHDLAPGTPARERVLGVLRTIYSDPAAHMELYLIAEDLVDFDTQLGLWRFHHVSVVERVIGFKSGTGGSSGSGYLRGTVEKKCFPLLWEVRGLLGTDTGAGERVGESGRGCPFAH
jgi:tryptophan 2,3-dioxygenase